MKKPVEITITVEDALQVIADLGDLDPARIDDKTKRFVNYLKYVTVMESARILR